MEQESALSSMADRLAIAANTALPDSPVDGSFGTAAAADPPKTMSPEKAALAAMFDSIQMPAPASPSKSPRKLALLTPSSKPLLSCGPLVPGRLLATNASPASKRQLRGAVASHASPSAKLSDMSVMLDPTGAQELLVNDRTLGSDSFLAAGVADVTINDSFDVSRARKKYSTRSTSAAQEKKAAQGLHGLGVGRVVKNAAGDDTIELSSFAAGSTSMMDNLLDESGQNSLLFGNSFSVSKAKAKARRSNASSSGSSSSGEDEEQVKLWNGELNHPSQALTTPKLVRRPLTGETAGSTTQSASVGAGHARNVSVGQAVAGPRRSLLPSAARAAPSTRLPPRSGPITPASSRLLESRGAPKTPGASSHAGLADVGEDGKTPMRQRRKSTFTASRPPVSGPVSRRESLLTAPPLPQAAPKTPGRTSAMRPKPSSPMSATKTPTAASSAVRTVPRPRASLTTAATPRTSTTALPTSSSSSSLSSLTDSAPVSRAAGGSLPRPRASLVGRTSTVAPRTSVITDATPKPAARPPRSSILGRSPSASQTRSTGAAAPETVRAARTLVPRASVGQGQTPLTARSTAVRSFSATVGSTASTDKVLGEISNVPSGPTATGVSKIARPRSSIAGPSSAPRVGSFGFRPRSSQVSPDTQPSGLT